MPIVVELPQAAGGVKDHWQQTCLFLTVRNEPSGHPPWTLGGISEHLGTMIMGINEYPIFDNSLSDKVAFFLSVEAENTLLTFSGIVVMPFHFDEFFVDMMEVTFLDVH